MAQRFYRAGFEKQLTGSKLGPKNCNMAAAAMLGDQATLGIKNPNPDALRTMSGDKVGGTTIHQAAAVLDEIGINTTVYDSTDGFTFDLLLAQLKRGRFAIVHGDYDQVPWSLRGDKDFDGLHSEFWHRVTTKGIVVGDPLNDGRRANIPKGYVTYPLSVARNYVDKFDRQVPGKGIHCALMDLKRLKARANTTTNVRTNPTRRSGVLGQIKGAMTLVWGGTVKGENIGGNDRWYRVWFPKTSSIGYCHSSVVVRV